MTSIRLVAHDTAAGEPTKVSLFRRPDQELRVGSYDKFQRTFLVPRAKTSILPGDADTAVTGPWQPGHTEAQAAAGVQSDPFQRR